MDIGNLEQISCFDDMFDFSHKEMLNHLFNLLPIESGVQYTYIHTYIYVYIYIMIIMYVCIYIYMIIYIHII